MSVISTRVPGVSEYVCSSVQLIVRGSRSHMGPRLPITTAVALGFAMRGVGSGELVQGCQNAAALERHTQLASCSVDARSGINCAGRPTSGNFVTNSALPRALGFPSL